MHVTSEEITTTVEALKKNGFDAIVVENGGDAKKEALARIPEGAEVMSMSLQTVEAIGLHQELNESGRYKSVRTRFKTMDPKTEGRKMRAMAATPEWSVGSVQAVTQDGHGSYAI